jgi:hypothetical protein
MSRSPTIADSRRQASKLPVICRLPDSESGCEIVPERSRIELPSLAQFLVETCMHAFVTPL